jgi:hypothetical protein
MIQFNKFPLLEKYAYIQFTERFDETRSISKIKGSGILRHWRQGQTALHRSFLRIAWLSNRPMPMNGAGFMVQAENISGTYRTWTRGCLWQKSPSDTIVCFCSSSICRVKPHSSTRLSGKSRVTLRNQSTLSGVQVVMNSRKRSAGPELYCLPTKYTWLTLTSSPAVSSYNCRHVYLSWLSSKVVSSPRGTNCGLGSAIYSISDSVAKAYSYMQLRNSPGSSRSGLVDDVKEGRVSADVAEAIVACRVSVEEGMKATNLVGDGVDNNTVSLAGCTLVRVNFWSSTRSLDFWAGRSAGPVKYSLMVWKLAIDVTVRVLTTLLQETNGRAHGSCDSRAPHRL